METEIDRRLKEIGEEITETERKTGELYQSDPENALLGNVRIGNAIEKRKALEKEAAALRTEKYLLEGEKKRSRQRLEAIRDPDFLRYVELGKAAEKEIYHETLINQAALQKSGVILPINTLDSFEDTGAMEPIDQKIYYYLWGKEGNETAAKSYKHSLERQINQKRSDEYLERIQKGAEEQPFRYGITSTLFRPTAAALTVGDMLKDWTSPEAEKGLLSDPNTPGKSMTRGIWAARQPGLDSIENPGAKKAANYMYNVVDMAPGAVLDALGTPGLGMAYRSMVRGTDGYVEAASQGATTEQALKEGKNRAAQGMFLENASQMAGNGQNNGFSWQPGDSQQSASLTLPNSGQLSGLSVEEAYAVLQSAGLSPQMIQEALESNGYFAENLLELPPAAGTGAGLSSQAFSGLPGNSGYLPENLLKLPGASAYEPLSTTLGRVGLEQSVFQGLMKNNGFSMDNALSRPSAQQAYHILQAEGFSPETSRYLLESNGYHLDDTSHLPDLLGDDTGEVLQRDEGLSGEMLELPKIGEEFGNGEKRLEKRGYSDILKGDYFSQIEEEADIPELYRNDFSDYEELTLTEQEADAFLSLHDKASENGKENAVAFVNGQMTEIFTSDFENRVGVPHELLEKQNVKIFHSHTNCTPPSGKDLEMLTNENVSEIGVITANGDIYTVSIGDGEHPLPEEFRMIEKQIQNEIDTAMVDYPDFWEWSIPQRNYMAIREKTYRIVRHFGWTIKGGKG